MNDIDPRAGTAELDDVLRRLVAWRPTGDGAALVDQISALERLRGAVAGAQAAAQVEFAETQRSEQIAQRVAARRLGTGIAEQIGFARRLSGWSAARSLAAALAWRDRLPETFALLRVGELSEQVAQVVATRTSHLSDRDAQQIDLDLAPDIRAWNVKQADQAAQDASYRLNPHAFVDRRAAAEGERRVSVRPAPDAMAYVTALLPAVEGVAVYKALRESAIASTAAGDERGQGQLMADTLVCRVTGQEQAHLVPIEVNLTMSSDNFLLDGDEAGYLEEFGPIDAAHARSIAAGEPPGAGEDDVTLRDVRRAKTWIRRLLTDPISGIAIDIDSRRRLFDDTVRRFVTRRDRTCRMPYCGAPIGHIDHITPYRIGGPTEISNAQGLNQRCNNVKEMPGWSVRKGEKPGETIVRTPTGHEYRSIPPPALGYGAKNQRLRRMIA